MGKRVCPHCGHVAKLSSFPLVDGHEDTVWCPGCDEEVLLSKMKTANNYLVKRVVTQFILIESESGPKAITKAEKMDMSVWDTQESDLIYEVVHRN